LGGKKRHGRRSRIGAAGALAAVLSLTLAACGGDSSTSSTPEPGGAYPVEVVTAELPARQRLGQTTLLRLGVRNDGERAMPELAVTISVAGEEGEASSLPFGIRSPEPGLAQPDRPVWVLSDRYPRLAGSDKPSGSEIASKKTYVFGPLEPGATTEAVWKLTAARIGPYRLLYEVDAGLGGRAKAETAAGVRPGGSFAVRIAKPPPETVVTDSGAVVEAQRPGEQTQANR
jgi:hypothetical protein